MFQSHVLYFVSPFAGVEVLAKTSRPDKIPTLDLCRALGSYAKNLSPESGDSTFARRISSLEGARVVWHARCFA